MNIFSKLFGRKKHGSRLESDNKNATQEKCNSCSDVNFLDEWESLVAECERCKRRETVKTLSTENIIRNIANKNIV